MGDVDDEVETEEGRHVGDVDEVETGGGGDRVGMP